MIRLTPLPQELVDRIIDHCYDDTLALLASALVCHSWLVPARYHLFRTVTLVPAVEGKRSFSSFTKILEVPSVCLSVKCLSIHSGEVALPIIFPVLRHLTRLRELSFYLVKFRASFAPTTLPGVLDVFSIHTCYFEGTEQVLNLLELYKSISKLKVVRPIWQLPLPAFPSPPPHGDTQVSTLKVHVGSLTYHDHDVDDEDLSSQFVDGLVKLVDNDSFTSLAVSLSAQRPQSHQKFSLLVLGASRSLKRLEIFMPMDSNRSQVSPATLDLSQCKALGTIEFQVHLASVGLLDEDLRGARHPAAILFCFQYHHHVDCHESDAL